MDFYVLPHVPISWDSYFGVGNLLFCLLVMPVFWRLEPPNLVVKTVPGASYYGLQQSLHLSALVRSILSAYHLSRTCTSGRLAVIYGESSELSVFPPTPSLWLCSHGGGGLQYCSVVENGFNWLDG